MKKIILQIYSYIVCFTCVCIVLVCSYGLLHSAASIVVPEYINAEKLHEYEKKVTDIKKGTVTSRDKLSEMEYIRKQDIAKIIDSSLIMLVSGVFFFFHWRVASRTYKNGG